MFCLQNCQKPVGVLATRRNGPRPKPTVSEVEQVLERTFPGVIESRRKADGDTFDRDAFILDVLRKTRQELWKFELACSPWVRGMIVDRLDKEGMPLFPAPFSNHLLPS